MKRFLKLPLIIVTTGIVLILIIDIFVLFNLETIASLETNAKDSETSRDELNQVFEKIYRNKEWSIQGDGSGPGSTIEYTKTCRNILYNLIRKYQIKSMLDVGCGSFLWMPLILKNISDEFRSKNESFTYHGVDVVEELINSARKKYSFMSNEWTFSVMDITKSKSSLAPYKYDLIFSRDTLMHLPFAKIVDTLEAISQLKGARFLLVGSYVQFGININIKMGDYFPINLIKPPFNLTGYREIFYEDKDSPVEFKKNLLLYDIPAYLSKIDFHQMKQTIKSYQ